MNKGFIVIIALLLVSDAILISCSSDNTSGITPTNEEGWICDNNRMGGIRVLTGPSKNAETSAYLTTCIACCRDVSVTSMKVDDGIAFYYVNAGGATGWVEGDYYYPEESGKPDWSNN